MSQQANFDSHWKTSFEKRRNETSAKHHPPQAKNIPHQHLFDSQLFSGLASNKTNIREFLQSVKGG